MNINLIIDYDHWLKWLIENKILKDDKSFTNYRNRIKEFNSHHSNILDVLNIKIIENYISSFNYEYKIQFINILKRFIQYLFNLPINEVNTGILQLEHYEKLKQDYVEKNKKKKELDGFTSYNPRKKTINDFDIPRSIHYKKQKIQDIIEQAKKERETITECNHSSVTNES